LVSAAFLRYFLASLTFFILFLIHHNFPRSMPSSAVHLDGAVSTAYQDDFPYPLPENSPGFVLLTGGLGYIGSHTTLELLKRGYDVVILDNLSNSFPVVFDQLTSVVSRYFEKLGKPMPVFRFYNVDYRDHVALKAIFDIYIHQIRGVIHLAASKSVVESIDQPLQYYANNVSGLIDFCSILGEYGIKSIVFSSSAAVYGSTANSLASLAEELCVHRSETYTDEDGKTHTIQPGCTGLTSPYSRTKWMGEAILADLCVSDPSWSVIALRYFNPIGCDASGVLGERARGTPTNLLPVVTSVLTGEQPVLNVYGSEYNTKDGTAVRDFIHVTDLALGHIAALDALTDGKVRGQFRAFNLGCSQGHSVLDVIRAMEGASRRTIPFRMMDPRPGDLSSCVAKAHRAEEELKWKAERPLETCASDLCNYLVVNGLLSPTADIA
jgi:UDP-glucose 4-epimerase